MLRVPHVAALPEQLLHQEPGGLLQGGLLQVRQGPIPPRAPDRAPETESRDGRVPKKQPSSPCGAGTAAARGEEGSEDGAGGSLPFPSSPLLSARKGCCGAEEAGHGWAPRGFPPPR